MIEYKNIYENDINGLKSKVEKLNKRAIKIGCSELVLNVVDEYTETEKYDVETGRELTIPRKVKKFDVEITGELPKYNGWVFIATIVGYKDGNNVIHKSPFVDKNIDVTKYRDEESHCDHCKTKRFRKNTYIIFNEKENKFYRVGSTCIRDFLGHNAPAISFMSKSIETLENYSFGGFKGNIFYDLESYLEVVCEVIDRHGYISKKKAIELEEKGIEVMSTTAWTNYFAFPPEYHYQQQDQKDFKVSAEAKEMAYNVIEWGKTLHEDENLNDYMHTLSVIFKNGCFDMKSAGYITSSIFAYKKAKGLLSDNKKSYKKISEYVGEINEKIEMELTLIKIFGFETKFGWTHFHIFEDKNDNEFVWYGNDVIHSKGKDKTRNYMEEGEIAKIKGTIKSHKLYDGKKQTILTRCSVIPK